MSGKMAGNLDALKISSEQRAGGGAERSSWRGARGWATLLVVGALAGAFWLQEDLTDVVSQIRAERDKDAVKVALVSSTAVATTSSDPTPVSVSALGRARKPSSPEQFSSTGYVQARESSQIAPKVPGRVLRVHVLQGDNVEPGQLLIELDPADEAAALRVAEREFSTAKAEARRALTNIEVVRANHVLAVRRAERAQKASAQGVSASGLAEDLVATAAALASEVRAAEASAEVAQARTGESAARVALRRTRLGNLSLQAPFRGVVVNEPPHVGEYIGPQPAGVAADMGGLRIANLSTLRVETDIPETRYRLLQVGTPTEIHLDAFPDRLFKGRVATVTSEVNRAKATIRVNVEFVGNTAGVVPDLAARVAFLLKAPQ